MGQEENERNPNPNRFKQNDLWKEKKKGKRKRREGEGKKRSRKARNHDDDHIHGRIHGERERKKEIWKGRRNGQLVVKNIHPFPFSRLNNVSFDDKIKKKKVWLYENESLDANINYLLLSFFFYI